jgi:hypothetical protein
MDSKDMSTQLGILRNGEDSPFLALGLGFDSQVLEFF